MNQSDHISKQKANSISLLLFELSRHGKMFNNHFFPHWVTITYNRLCSAPINFKTKINWTINCHRQSSNMCAFHQKTNSHRWTKRPKKELTVTRFFRFTTSLICFNRKSHRLIFIVMWSTNVSHPRLRMRVLFSSQIFHTSPKKKEKQFVSAYCAVFVNDEFTTPSLTLFHTHTHEHTHPHILTIACHSHSKVFWYTFENNLYQMYIY